MLGADKGQEQALNGSRLRIGIVQARFNEGVTGALHAALAHIQQAGRGVAVLLNCGEDAAQLLAQFEGTARAAHAPERGRMDLRSYGVGAQILRDLGVQRMQVMGAPRRLPSMAGGYGLEIVEYVDHNDQGNTANARG